MISVAGARRDVMARRHRGPSALTAVGTNVHAHTSRFEALTRLCDHSDSDCLFREASRPRGPPKALVYFYKMK